MSVGADRLVKNAISQIGYLEKGKSAFQADPSVLDSFTDGAGADNITKYARDQWKERYFNSSKQGIAWCAVFVGWCFLETFGKANALKLQCQPTSGNCGAGCKSAADYYRKKNQFYSDPQIGDQIFFGASGNETHTGIVVEVDGAKIWTVEGNTSSSAGIVENGGAVCRKSYQRTNSRISGYGRPDWSIVDNDKDDEDGVCMEAVVVVPSGDTANLRAGMSINAARLAKVPAGSSVEVLEDLGTWCRIRWGKYTGYMMSNYLDYSDMPDDTGDDDSDSVTITIPKAVAEKFRDYLVAALGVG